MLTKPSTFTCLECRHIYIGIICNVCKVPKGELSCGCKFDHGERTFCCDEHFWSHDDEKLDSPTHVPYSNIRRD